MKLIVALCIGLAAGCASSRESSTSVSPVPTPKQVIESKRDLWGDLAMKQPGGASYEFFEKLVPPLRYVDSDFQHYPIVLSAPGAMVKARLLSNGSQINARADQPNWVNETGIPVHIFVSDHREAFGDDLSRLTGPKLQ